MTTTTAVTPAARRARRRAIGLGVLIGLAAVAVVAWRDRAASTTTSVTSAATLRPAPPRRPPLAGAPAFAPDRLAAIADDYARAAAYPPDARPFDDGTAYKLAWNAPSTPDLPALGDGGLAIRFGADRAHVLPDGTLTSWLEVVPIAAPTRRVPATIVEAWVTTTGGEAVGRLAPLAYRDDGSHRYVNTLRPGDLAPLAERAAAVRLVALVEVDGHVNQVVRDFTFTPRVAVRVTGVHDAIVDGSLVVTLDVETLEQALFGFEANLVGADGTPVAWVDTGAELARGHHAVALRFFGKAVRDGGVAGPYVVRDVRGTVRSPDDDEMPLRWAWDGTHTTAPYPLTALSPAPWDAPEKQARLAALAALRDAPATGEPARIVVIDADGVAREVPADDPPAP